MVPANWPLFLNASYIFNCSLFLVICYFLTVSYPLKLTCALKSNRSVFNIEPLSYEQMKAIAQYFYCAYLQCSVNSSITIRLNWISFGKVAVKWSGLGVWYRNVVHCREIGCNIFRVSVFETSGFARLIKLKSLPLMGEGIHCSCDVHFEHYFMLQVWKEDTTPAK